jgi:hypothetical protein
VIDEIYMRAEISALAAGEIHKIYMRAECRVSYAVALE